MDEVRVLITLDCERPNSETDPRASGPPDYATGVASTLGYVETAAARGFPVTLFIHPEVANADAAVFADLESKGNTLGLHLHPWRFSDGKYGAELGGLSESKARAAISEAAAVWQSAVGRRPDLFRAGAASANDSTFRILADLGFRGGSTTIPGRVYPDIHAIWAGSDPDPHRANGVLRQIAGELDFAEMPISVDLSRQIHKNGRSYHWELRPDWDVPYLEVAENILNQVKARNPSVPVINMVTHNDHDFADPSSPSAIAFTAILDAIEKACEAAKLLPVPATVDDVVDEVLAHPGRPFTLNPASGKVTEEDGEVVQLTMPHGYRIGPGHAGAER